LLKRAARAEKRRCRTGEKHSVDRVTGEAARAELTTAE
jgi:hypothetical protein